MSPDRITLDLDPLDFVDPERYGERGYPHDAWTRLRREDPVHWCEPAGFRPFWAITKHEDIRMISTQPERFISKPRWLLLPEKVARVTEEKFPGSYDQGGTPLRGLTNMDGQDHRTYRNLAGPFFRPRTLARLEDHMREVTRLLLDRYQGTDVELDFVDDVAQWHPLRLICEILGVAADNEHLISRLTSALFAPDDDEFAPEDSAALFAEMFTFFNGVIEEKRATPTDDLATVLVQATIDGRSLPELELVTYFIFIATAGHHTTRSSLGGGMHALLAHPEQLERLQHEPALCKPAADEIARWTSPITHFMRTATEETELRGKVIRPGESVALFYPSANRDQDVFDDPFEFRIDREPNPHLAFGIGEHFCLGASLARMEIRVLLEELIPRLRTVEEIGAPQHLHAHFVSGVKHLPLRWTLE